jgi:hypothetical protein
MGKEGTWWLHSKKDRRWKRSGQSGACDAMTRPPEAEAALAELRRTLGEEPPDDLRCTFMPNKPGNRLSRLHDLCAAHAALSSEKQRALAAALGDGPWHYSIGAGTISLDGGRFVLPMQLLGTHAEESNTWLWAWANEVSNYPPELLTSANRLRQIGLEAGVAELTQPLLDLGSADDRPWFDGYYLAMAATGLCQADCYYRAPYEGGALFVLLQAPQVWAGAPQDAGHMTMALADLLGTADGAVLDHKTVVCSYARQKGYRVSDAGEQMTCTGAGGEELVVTFDAAGAITRLTADVVPRPDPGTGEGGTKRWWRFRWTPAPEPPNDPKLPTVAPVRRLVDWSSGMGRGG